jgi:hypothetical protein
MRKHKRYQEKGSSLLLAILALLLLSALAMGMAFMSGTETAVNANFKAEETAYFAARGGVEEVRDRLLPNNPNTLTASLPTTMPTVTGGGVLYVLQSGVSSSSITGTGQLRDDELCHDFGGFSTQTVAANVPCPSLPTGFSPQTTSSVAPYSLDYKWVRVTLKENGSGAYCVDGTAPPSACTNSNQVCWDGISEKVLPTGTASCNAMSPRANPVYLVTALAVTSEGATSGARRLVQQEISQTPLQSFPYGLFATGTGCGALSMSGGAQTYSFNSATENPIANPPSNWVASGGNVGANGNVGLSGNGTSVNGTTSSSIGGIGNCNQGNGITAGGGANYGTASQIPAQSLPIPPLPNPLPPTTSQNISSSQALSPGSYGDLKIQGGATVTLAGGTATSPAVYTLNSISLSGGSTLQINGYVVFDIAGVGKTDVIDFTGGTFSNTTSNPNAFVINYGGTANIKLSGGSAAYAQINSPAASIAFSGGGNFYGQAIGSTISVTGGGNFYYDTSLQNNNTNNNAFYEISMRELSY